MKKRKRSNSDTESPVHKLNEDIDESLPITFEDISKAALRIKSGIKHTQCKRSNSFSSMFGMDIWFKNDYKQFTGSFKERGARNTLLKLSDDQKKVGVIAASAGNHALALAYHGRLLNIPVTVVMPDIAPVTKVEKCRHEKANVIIKGSHIGESKEHAMALAQHNGMKYINGYDHVDILAGAGTMGLEILDTVPDVDTIVVPVGGAGLIAGISLAAKTLNPSVQIIGVEPLRCASLTAALKAGKPVAADVSSTLADGLAVPVVGGNSFNVAKKYVDKVVTVQDRFIALGVLRLLENERRIVEGAGAAGVAALCEGLLPELKGKKVVIPLCGGNIDTAVLGRIVERGLAADGRMVHFKVTVPDKPGGLSALTKLFHEMGVSIKDITHERAWLCNDVFKVQNTCVVETLGHDHAEKLRQRLLDEGYPLLWNPIELES